MTAFVRNTIIVVAVLFAAIVAFALVAEFNEDQAAQVQTSASPTPKPATKDELLRLVNEERKKAGVAPLTIDSRVAKSAQLKAEDMVRFDYREHEIPRLGKILTPEMDALITQACDVYSENIIWNNDWEKGNTDPGTSNVVMETWKESKSHYEAMIASRYTSTGFGIKNDVVVQHFCIAK